MARVKDKNLEKVKKNLTPHVENVSGVKFKVAEILREVQEIDTDDYVEILRYVMRQPFSKIRFMVQSCADLPIFVKNICSSFLSDTKNGKNYTLNEILNRVYGLPKSIQETTIESSAPQINITLESNFDAENLNKLLNGNNKDVLENT